MSESIQFLNRVRIASPCPKVWEELDPVDDGEEVRHCGLCRLNVFNLSGMPAKAAEALLREHEGKRLCVTYFLRQDGTIMTKDCPTGVRIARQRTAPRRRAAAFYAAALAGAVTVIPLTSFNLGAGNRTLGAPSVAWSPQAEETSPVLGAMATACPPAAPKPSESPKVVDMPMGEMVVGRAANPQ